MSQQVFSAKNLPRELQEQSNSTRAASYLQKSALNLTLLLFRIGSRLPKASTLNTKRDIKGLCLFLLIAADLQKLLPSIKACKFG